MTYRELLAELQGLDDDQLDSDVTVELGLEDECYPAELRICDTDHFAHNGSLDEFHPVIYVEDA